MNDQITVCGHVATDPKHHRTTSGLDITSFRLASQQRRYDQKQGSWVAQETNWYTVSAFRGLATASATSLVKGQRVIVLGRLRIRDWEQGERRGTSVDIEADHIGPDIGWQPKGSGESPVGAGVSPAPAASESSGSGTGTGEWAPAPPQDTPF